MLDEDFQLIAGRISLLAGTKQGLLIGTDREIWWLPNEGSVQALAEYGVIDGNHVLDDRGQVYFWTERGLCRVAPFECLTDDRLAINIRDKGTLGILPWN